jgi:hypothetical protein
MVERDVIDATNKGKKYNQENTWKEVVRRVGLQSVGDREKIYNQENKEESC